MRLATLVPLLCLLSLACASDEKKLTFRLVDAQTQQPLAGHKVHCYRESRGQYIRGPFDTDADGRLSEVITRNGDFFRMTPEGYRPIAAKVQEGQLTFVSPAERGADGADPKETTVPLAETTTVTIPATKNP